jgi:hypothetical protein
MGEAAWSQEIPFERAIIQQQVPHAAGVYEILQTPNYPRYRATTPVLKIGKSDGSLQGEVLNHFIRHTAANRLHGIRLQPGVQVFVRYKVLDAVDVGGTESQLLREFEDRHWDIPLLNSQRGYGRDQDRHYRG